MAPGLDALDMVVVTRDDKVARISNETDDADVLEPVKVDCVATDRANAIAIAVLIKFIGAVMEVPKAPRHAEVEPAGTLVRPTHVHREAFVEATMNSDRTPIGSASWIGVRCHPHTTPSR